MKEAVHDMYLLGRTHFNHGEYQEAKRCFEMVLDQEPHLAEVHSKLGLIYHAEDNFHKASDAFRRALEINPNYTEASLNLVISLNESGRFDEAEEVFKKAAQVVKASPFSLDPFIKGKLAGMHVETGDAYVEIGWFDEAIHEYSLALKLRPESVEVLTKLGLAHRGKGDFDGAIHFFRRGKALSPSYVPVMLHLGFTFYKQGQIAFAVEEWNAARRIDPDNKEAATFLRLVEPSD